MYDAIVIGAGAAGLMCAITAGKRGKRVLVLDHANKVGKKILMSGGGRCNFTNLDTTPENYISQNPHFCKSALQRYSQWDFISMVATHNIPYHEKTLGQLFCDNKSRDILDMLLAECASVGVKIYASTTVNKITKVEDEFRLTTTKGDFSAPSLVIATGGLSIPKMGATGFGYEVAKQFGIKLLSRTAGLVPFTLADRMLVKCQALAGTALPVAVSANEQTFSEAMLFTHKGLSGPAMLQASSYWQAGTPITINLLAGVSDLHETLIAIRQNQPKSELKTFLSKQTTKQFATFLCEHIVSNHVFANLSNVQIADIAEKLSSWQVFPAGTEGYRTAEVTLGGVSTDELSSKTMMANKVANLFFIGEVVDVTGWLGGYNFQWAWSSGYAAGSYV